MSDNTVKGFMADRLSVQIYPDGAALGKAAAEFAAARLQTALAKKGRANLILATGASQFAFLEHFCSLAIDWGKITVFHLDEYLGLSDQHPASFRRYLRERILDQVKPKKVYFLHGDADDPEAETARYEKQLSSHPVDVACIGIGENGHLAFNDPPVADFNDPRLVKIVDLDQVCRRQQHSEGWFPTLDDVPRQALSLTIPAIMRSKAISCVVPDERKAEAIYKTLFGPVSTVCPASILRNHTDAVLFLDQFSASKL